MAAAPTLTSADTLWLHVRSMGQWTNRLYEYFRQPESQVVSSKRLSTSLRKHRQLLKAQVRVWPSSGLGNGFHFLRASPDLT